MRRSGQGVLNLVLLSMMGVVLGLCGFLLIGFWPDGPGAFRARCALGVLVLLGLALATWPQMRLREGIRLEWWDAAEFSRVRAVSEHELMNVVSWGLLGLAMVLFLLSRPPHHREFSAAYWACFLLLQEINGLRTSLREPLRAKPREVIQALKPLQSDHWGEQAR